MRLFAALLVLMSASGLPAWGQWSDDAERCAKISDPYQRLPYCTAAIESGQLSTGNLAITFYNRGIAYLDRLAHDRAIQDFDQAIRLNPSLGFAFNNRGLAYSRKGNDDRAIQDFDQAIRLDPSNVIAFDNRGSAYQDKGDYDRAIQDFDQVIRLNPSRPRYFYNRASAYRPLGSPEWRPDRSKKMEETCMIDPE